MNQQTFNFKQAHGGIGILTDADVADLNAGSKRVYELMRDRQWHTRTEIDLAAGKNGMPALEGTRRLRDVRQALKPYGLKIEKRRKNGTRLWEYQIQKIQNDG